MCRELIKRSLILVILTTLCCANTSYLVANSIEKNNINTLRPLSSKIKGNGGNIIVNSSAAKGSSSGDAIPKNILIGKNPQPYLSPEFTNSEWRDVLTELGGSIVDISMEAILPELYENALEGSKGGLGILEGDSGEGYGKAVWNAHVPGIKAFITMPMYEYKLVANTDLNAKKQYLQSYKVNYDQIIDYDNPVDYNIFSEPDRFDFLELKSNPSRPIKPVVNEKGDELSFRVKLYDELLGVSRNFKAVVFVINRGGTPAFLIACQDIKHILYPDDESSRLNQQILMGKVTPLLYKKLGIKPAVMRVNEAHTVIAMAQMMIDPYFKDTAFVFTNHTPITAGLQIYHGKVHWFSRLGLPDVFEDKARNLKVNFRAIFINNNDLDFSRAAMSLAQIVNGVSNAHGITLQKMFPDFKDKIRAILNGTGEFWKSDILKDAEKDNIDIAPDALWQLHQKDKKTLVELVKDRTGREIDINMPTAVAIRRIDYYKQQYPMLKDIVKALCQDRGVKTKVSLDGKEQILEGLGMQVIVGGIIVNEYNPDLQYWISEFISWMQDPDFKNRFIFISGNDLELMKKAANGCDCWFEIPRRNMHTGDQEEACGTSGMRSTTSGNPSIMSSGMWGDEFVSQYNPETNEGNGFILEDITSRELYDALSTISGLYYDFMDNGDTRFLDLRKRVYEDSRVLYIENMAMRYISDIYIPAIRCKRIEDAIRNTAKFSSLPGKNGFIGLGEVMNISATVILDKVYSSHIGGIKAQIWTDIDSPGDWYAVNMDAFEVHSNKEGYVFKFTGAIAPSAMGNYYYKVRFLVKENGRYIYLPQRYGNDIRIIVDKPDLEDALQSIPILDTDIINHQIDSAA